MRPHFPLAKAMLWPGAPQSVQTVTGLGSFMRWYGAFYQLNQSDGCVRFYLMMRGILGGFRQASLSACSTASALPGTGSPGLDMPKMRILFTRILLIPSTSDSSRRGFAAL